MNNLVTDIMERFENLLDEKGIEIPCEDQIEQEERHAENNTAKLYGMEYAALSDEIASLLSGYPCSIFSPMGDVEGCLSFDDAEELRVEQQLQKDNKIMKEYEHTPREMAEKLMEFNRDFSDDEVIASEVDYITELFDELQKSEKFNAMAHHLDLMFMDSVFK